MDVDRGPGEAVPDTHPPRPPLGRYPRTRLFILLSLLVAAAAVFTFGGVVGVAEVQDAVEGLGPAAPVAYLAVSAVLAAVLVPGPVLAAAGGLLFGAALGTVVTLLSALATSVIALLLGRVAGRDGARAVLGARRAAAMEGLLARRGLLAVVGQRLLPGVPDAPASYTFGALGAGVWQITLGTLIGAAPRAFAYTAVGASLDDPSSPLALAGIATWIVVTVAGAELGRRTWRARGRDRRSRAA